jgi:hypothetical protein
VPRASAAQSSEPLSGEPPQGSAPTPGTADAPAAFVDLSSSVPLVARAASPAQQEVMFLPLAVSMGDGFKFGCGFFLALVLAMLVGFVLLTALFVLTGIFGLNLPLSR